MPARDFNMVLTHKVMDDGQESLLSSPVQGARTSKWFKNYTCLAVNTDFTLKEFGCQFFMTKGWVFGILAKWCVNLGHDFIIKHRYPHLSRVCLPVARWLHGFFEALVDRIKGVFLHGVSPQRYKNYISSRRRTVKDCTN